MRTITETQREIPVSHQTDVLVVGAGPAGIMAALAAAQHGVKVTLVESRSFVGGNLTMGLPILGFLGEKKNQIIKGLAQKFIDRLAAKGAATGHKPCKLHVSLTIIDSEEAKTTALEMLREAGVEIKLYQFCAGAVVENGEIKGIITESKSGRAAILAKTVIDCTGDGDVAWLAGAKCEKGNEQGGMQPPTLMFCMKNVDVAALRKAIVERPEVYDMDIMPAEQFREGKFITVGLRQMIENAKKDGIKVPVARTILITGMAEDEIWVNMSRVTGVDSTDPESYTRGEIEGRDQIYEIEKYLKGYVPGFANARIEKVAPFMGIRESRRVVGRYMLTGEDILCCRHFDDSIAVASYPVDLHHPQGGDCTLEYCGDCYDIPYRCLLPATIENLMIAGRCAGTTHEAMASTRVMSTCMAMGEAAGHGAAIAIADGVAPSQVDAAKVRSAILANGGYLR